MVDFICVKNIKMYDSYNPIFYCIANQVSGICIMAREECEEKAKIMRNEITTVITIIRDDKIAMSISMRPLIEFEVYTMDDLKRLSETMFKISMCEGR